MYHLPSHMFLALMVSLLPYVIFIKIDSLIYWIQNKNNFVVIVIYIMIFKNRVCIRFVLTNMIYIYLLKIIQFFCNSSGQKSEIVSLAWK